MEKMDHQSNLFTTCKKYARIISALAILVLPLVYFTIMIDFKVILFLIFKLFHLSMDEPTMEDMADNCCINLEFNLRYGLFALFFVGLIFYWCSHQREETMDAETMRAILVSLDNKIGAIGLNFQENPHDDDIHGPIVNNAAVGIFAGIPNGVFVDAEMRARRRANKNKNDIGAPAGETTIEKADF